MKGNWHALVLAAGRGASDPMAKAYGVTHKATLPVAGIPMLRRVVSALESSRSIASITVSVEDPEILRQTLGADASAVSFSRSVQSAPASVIAAVQAANRFPLLVTTADHALLTPAMVDHFCSEAAGNAADFSAGLATAETILAAYPQSVRTFFRLGPDKVSGCNLFALSNERALKLVERWQYLDQLRKKPWRLVAAFGPAAIIRFALGGLTLQSAFELISKRLELVAKPVLMPFAEAAIDVDKPADLELAEMILKSR